MNNKIVMYVSIAAAIVAAAISAIVVTNNRATIARTRASEAESREAAAASEAKKAKAEESAAAQRAAAKEAEAKAAEENRKAQEAERETAKANAAAEADAKATAKLAAEKARDEANAAADARATAKLEADKARAAVEAVRLATDAEIAKSNALARAAADALEAERVKAEKILAEARLLESRKIDFETWQARLLELDQDLAERERALTPDVSINDSTNITWVAEREADVIGGDTNALARLKRKKVPTENDLSLPEPTRRLARQERLVSEASVDGLNATSNTVVSTLTRLYVQAVQDGRVVDAEFYRKSIKHYYPNWEYKKP